jgi:hypothetical protein
MAARLRRIQSHFEGGNVNESETPRVQSLAEWWLDIATAGLSAPAKERIRLEIEAHFADGVENHQANDCSVADARLAAFAELGNPTLAAKRFRKRHLTENEAKRLGSMFKYGMKRLWLLVGCAVYVPFYYASLLSNANHPHTALATEAVLLCITLQTIWWGSMLKHGAKPLWLLVDCPVYVLFCVYAFLLWNANHPHIALATGAVFLSMTLLTIGFVVARRKSCKPDIRFLLFTDILHSGSLALLFSVVWFGGEWGVFCAMFLSQIVSSVPDFLLWFKLGQIDHAGLEMPSRGAPAS